MSISEWQDQGERTGSRDASGHVVSGAPLVAVVPPPARESADAELGHRLAGDLAALTRVLLGPDLPLSAVVVEHQPVPAVIEAYAVADVAEQVAIENLVVADLVVAEPLVLEPAPFSPAEDTAEHMAIGGFVAPPVVEIEPLFIQSAADEASAFVAPPVVEVEPLVPLEPPPPKPSRQMIDELSSLDL